MERYAQPRCGSSTYQCPSYRAKSTAYARAAAGERRSAARRGAASACLARARGLQLLVEGLLEIRLVRAGDERGRDPVRGRLDFQSHQEQSCSSRQPLLRLGNAQLRTQDTRSPGKLHGFDPSRPHDAAPMARCASSASAIQSCTDSRCSADVISGPGMCAGRR